jgi:hypothetical protein
VHSTLAQKVLRGSVSCLRDADCHLKPWDGSWGMRRLDNGRIEFGSGQNFKPLNLSAVKVSCQTIKNPRFQYHQIALKRSRRTVEIVMISITMIYRRSWPSTIRHIVSESSTPDRSHDHASPFRNCGRVDRQENSQLFLLIPRKEVTSS